MAFVSTFKIQEARHLLSRTAFVSRFKCSAARVRVATPARGHQPGADLVRRDATAARRQHRVPHVIREPGQRGVEDLAGPAGSSTPDRTAGGYGLNRFDSRVQFKSMIRKGWICLCYMCSGDTIDFIIGTLHSSQAL
jgi:hypothetical protein